MRAPDDGLETGVIITEDPGAAQLAQARQQQWIDELSPEDRQALIRGEGFPSRRQPIHRIIRGTSQQAANLLLLLERAGGERSVRSLVAIPASGGFVSAAAAELMELGLIERVGDGIERRLRRTADAEGVLLQSSWSMVG
jgi:hypothetical protein